MAFIDTQVRPQGEQVDAIAPSKLKLSAAIRIGAKIRPQVRDVYFGDGGSCAIGAALEATGILKYGERGFGAWDRLVKLLKFPYDLHAPISNRNDKGETREQIADWLQSIGL